MGTKFAEAFDITYLTKENKHTHAHTTSWGVSTRLLGALMMGVVNDEQLQVIIGPGKVNKVANAMVAKAGVDLGQEIPQQKSGKEALSEKTAEMKAAQKAKQKSSPLKSLLKDISNIFVPMIPAFVGAGLVAGIASVLTNMITAGRLDGDTWNYYVMILNVLRNGMFTYLAIFTGVNAAQVFKANPTLGGVIGSIILLTGMNPGDFLATDFLQFFFGFFQNVRPIEEDLAIIDIGIAG